MKVLLINGSPRRNGNTHTALTEVASTLQANGIETEMAWIGTKAVQGCINCDKCKSLGRCIFNDALYNDVCAKLAETDGLVVGTPVYYGGPNGSLCSLLDRLFYSASPLLQNKPATSVVACRRGGATAPWTYYHMMADWGKASPKYSKMLS